VDGVDEGGGVEVEGRRVDQVLRAGHGVGDGDGPGDGLVGVLRGPGVAARGDGQGRGARLLCRERVVAVRVEGVDPERRALEDGGELLDAGHRQREDDALHAAQLAGGGSRGVPQGDGVEGGGSDAHEGDRARGRAGAGDARHLVPPSRDGERDELGRVELEALGRVHADAVLLGGDGDDEDVGGGLDGAVGGDGEEGSGHGPRAYRRRGARRPRPGTRRAGACSLWAAPPRPHPRRAVRSAA
jgi:hypothetical protein